MAIRLRFILIEPCAELLGYHDIGEVWREELEIPSLRTNVSTLMANVKPFYELLHGVLRNLLWNKVNTYESFDKDKTIPAHLLGNCVRCILAISNYK